MRRVGVSKRRDDKLEGPSVLHPGQFDHERGGSAPRKEGCDVGHAVADDLVPSILRLGGHPDIHNIPWAVVDDFSHEYDRGGFVSRAVESDPNSGPPGPAVELAALQQDQRRIFRPDRTARAGHMIRCYPLRVEAFEATA